MQRHGLFSLVKDPLWVKVTSLATILFFIFLSDAILSYWVPNFLENTLKRTSKVGLIMGFSSVVGLAVDLILPQIIKGVSVRKLVFISLISSLIFSLTLLWGTFTPFILVFLLAMAIWGIYYEFLGFAQQQFVADATPLKFHSATWGILGVFKSLAYFLGPVISGRFLVHGERTPLYLALGFAFISFSVMVIHHTKHARAIDFQFGEVNLGRELSHWLVLFTHVWPVILMSLIVGTIDAAFWTIGPIVSQNLAERSWLGGMFLSVYVLPSLFSGLIVARWGIYRGKKKVAEKFLIVSGVLFSLIGFFDAIYWQISIVFLGSLAISLAYPLIDAVYSDITSRMGRERKHMIGLTNSTLSLSYIFGPPLAGFIASLVGEKSTFSVLGVFAALISIVLLFSTPKKLLLPQSDIGRWKD